MNTRPRTTKEKEQLINNISNLYFKCFALSLILSIYKIEVLFPKYINTIKEINDFIETKENKTCTNITLKTKLIASIMVLFPLSIIAIVIFS